MIFSRPKNSIRILSFALAILMLVTSISTVYATGTIDSLESTTTDLEDKLSGLNKELNSLNKEISSIAKRLKKMTDRIEETQKSLAIARGKEEAQYDSMKLRIKYIYESGNANALELLFSSSSMADFLNRAEYVAMVNEYDRNALKDLQKTREAITEQEAQLAKDQENLTDLQADLKAKKKTLSTKIAQTSEDLTTSQKQLEEAKEATRRAEEEARKAAEALAQQLKPIKPNKPNISIDRTDDDDFDYAASASDVELFAGIIECEAGSSNYDGMLAVASVIVNRMKHSHYPDTLRGVIYQSGQFPPAHNGKLDRILKRGVKQSCINVANDALSGKNNVGSCLSFRSASSGHAGTIIGSNVFF